MRGKLGRRLSRAHAGRITPADAGKTAMFTFADADVMDHPRGCGENQGESMDAIAGRGSPPRMRGKLINYRQAHTE